MKLLKLFVLLGLTFEGVAACSSVPEPQIQKRVVEKLQPSLEAHFCHMDLTDLLQSVLQQRLEPTDSASQFYEKRMELQQKLNGWIQKDAQLSLECQKLSYEIQNEWRQKEEWLLSLKSFEGPAEQRVFTNSQWQLNSNPYLDKAGPVTSLSELKNGDVVLADEKLSVIEKNENGDLRSWHPDTPGRWVQLSMNHAMGWLKQPSKRVIVLRHWNSDSADQMVRWVQAQRGEKRQELREPSSVWTALALSLRLSPDLPLEANPNFIQVFEWKNHSALPKK